MVAPESNRRMPAIPGARARPRGWRDHLHRARAGLRTAPERVPWLLIALLVNIGVIFSVVPRHGDSAPPTSAVTSVWDRTAKAVRRAERRAAIRAEHRERAQQVASAVAAIRANPDDEDARARLDELLELRRLGMGVPVDFDALRRRHEPDFQPRPRARHLW